MVGPSSRSPPLPDVANFASTYRAIAPSGTLTLRLRPRIVAIGSSREYDAMSVLKLASGSSGDHGPSQRSSRTISGSSAASTLTIVHYLGTPRLFAIIIRAEHFGAMSYGRDCSMATSGI